MLLDSRPLQQTLQASSTLEHLHGFMFFAVQNGLHSPPMHVPLEIYNTKKHEQVTKSNLEIDYLYYANNYN